ncbi:hypothetical protein [Exiguobacterium sp. SH0S2]|uniref:hypothetical protein n=1 Tax=Exiguobacterium sp. SH0S2 TaxID=2510950 RepID=UPI00103E6B62|nr:hypothetical protein [Exiguobacterium sp. SH0S2]TCI59097.1 hypothetical protein EVJ21_14265 [Exiguobacterium sp. SH0S2]
MRLQDWIQQYHGTEILHFDHLCEYLDATPFEIKSHLDQISPEITGVLKFEGGVDDDAFITKLEHHLLNRFNKRRKKVKVTIEVELPLPEEAYNFCQRERFSMIERVTRYMEEQNVKDWRIVNMRRI